MWTQKNQQKDQQNNQLQPMAVQLGSAHGLPKVHKSYANLPSFRPNIDTTSTPYYNIGKFLSSSM